MTKKLNTLALAIFAVSVTPFTVLAGTTICVCEPREITVGFTGQNDKYMKVNCIDGSSYPLGRVDDLKSNMYLSLVSSALVADKRVRVTFWDAADRSCEDYSEQWREAPVGIGLIK
ncbi:hypothetical protein [Ferrimonas pelagia]|uniref:Uncharacterized protein n=1 Tax=Ferrimonas pelagia TaxID=1177826 RepID=A0ABP9EFV0_9GAMM